MKFNFCWHWKQRVSWLGTKALVHWHCSRWSGMNSCISRWQCACKLVSGISGYMPMYKVQHFLVLLGESNWMEKLQQKMQPNLKYCSFRRCCCSPAWNERVVSFPFHIILLIKIITTTSTVLVRWCSCCSHWFTFPLRISLEKRFIRSFKVHGVVERRR